MLNKDNPFYREVTATHKITMAEATIAWFYSGKKQDRATITTKLPVYADGIFDCTAIMQKAIDQGHVFIPEARFCITSPLTVSTNNTIISGNGKNNRITIGMGGSNGQ